MSLSEWIDACRLTCRFTASPGPLQMSQKYKIATGKKHEAPEVWYFQNIQMNLLNHFYAVSDKEC